MHQNVTINLGANRMTKIVEQIFIFCECPCFRSRVVAGSVLGYDTVSLGDLFLAKAREVLPTKC